jgi:hypothetical protein
VLGVCMQSSHEKYQQTMHTCATACLSSASQSPAWQLRISSSLAQNPGQALARFWTVGTTSNSLRAHVTDTYEMHGVCWLENNVV